MLRGIRRCVCLNCRRGLIVLLGYRRRLCVATAWLHIDRGRLNITITRRRNDINGRRGGVVRIWIVIMRVVIVRIQRNADANADANAAACEC